MRKTTLLFASLALLVACGDKDDTGDTGALSGDATAGADVYAGNCAACHGSDGTNGASGPDLSGLVPGMSDSALESVIKNGVGSMPAISTLDDQEVADVVAWLRQEFG